MAGDSGTERRLFPLNVIDFAPSLNPESDDRQAALNHRRN